METLTRMPFSDTRYHLSETGLPFLGGGRPENDTRKWKPEKTPVSSMYGLETEFATRKRVFSDPEPVL